MDFADGIALRDFTVDGAGVVDGNDDLADLGAESRLRLVAVRQGLTGGLTSMEQCSATYASRSQAAADVDGSSGSNTSKRLERAGKFD